MNKKYLSHFRKKKNQASWYFNRLRAMTVSEYIYRISSRRVRVNERKQYEKYAANDHLNLPMDRNQDADIEHKSKVRFFFDIEQVEEIRSIFESMYSIELVANLDRSQKILDHNIDLFNEEFDLGVEINWSQDPRTKHVWPRAFWGDIDTRDSEGFGGVKWVWELNRHHHILTLAKAYFTNEKEKYAQEVCAQLESWIMQNPPLMGVNWTSSLELAIRMINWTWVLSFLSKSPSLTGNHLEMITRSIIDQTSYIYRHISAYSSANNHLIGEAAGLAVVGMAFPWLPDAQEWRQRGFFILESELEKQIYPDGTPAEQATSYLAFILDFNLLVWRLAALNGYSVPEIWYERLNAACSFIISLADGRGNISSIGDSDDGWVVRLDDRPNVDNYHSILASAAAILGRSDFKTDFTRWDEKSYWILNTQGYDEFCGLVSEKKCLPSSRIFRNGGYCIMKTEQLLLAFDCGPLGFLSTAAHGHADALSIWLSVNGIPLLIDAGTYAYQEGREWRDYFRGTSAHNTIRIGKRDQSEILGTFLWGKRARAKLLRWESNQRFDLAVAEHDGYKNFGIIHRRAVMFIKPNVIVVEDYLSGTSKYLVEQLWHFPKKSKLEIQNELVRIELNENRYWIWIDQQNRDLDTRIISGQESPPQGWISKRYGSIHPAPVLSYLGELLLPARISIGFYLNQAANEDEIGLIMNKAFDFLREIRQGEVN